MNKQELLKIVNEGWSWFGVSAIDIKMENEFGNIIFQSNEGKFFRICPEELSCELIANTEKDYVSVINSQDFQGDWRMESLVSVAKDKLGTLGKGEKYCLKIPAIIGGKYSRQNIGKITFDELILCSGDLAFQIKDLEDGQKIEINIKN
ncbi:MAG: T6SS immunity protein Tdi1 domain-containing protein [Bacteroidota bacterium]